MGAREDILAAIDRLNRPTFTIMDVIDHHAYDVAFSPDGQALVVA